MIPYSKQLISAKDRKEVDKVLKSNFLTQGPMVKKFEDEIRKFVGSKYAIAVNSATSALHLSCLALGLKKNDLVWTSTNTFVSTANSAILSGAKVDFVDISLEDYNMSIKALTKKLKIAKIRKKLPKVIIPVHFAGRPCKMKEIYNLSKKYGFKIIEDASHALGSEIYGEKIGNCKYSDLCIFSFHPVKNITTGEGGLVTTNNKFFFENIEMLRTHGITKDKKKFKLKNPPPWYFEQLSLGLNYRMNDIEAALGVSQFKSLKKFLKLRNNIAKFYNKKLSNLNLHLPKIDKNINNAFHLYPVRTIGHKSKSIRLKLFKYLRKKKINVNIHYIPVYSHPYYKKIGYKKTNFPNMELYYNSVLSLPIYPGLKKREIVKVINYIKKIINEKKFSVCSDKE